MLENTLRAQIMKEGNTVSIDKKVFDLFKCMVVEDENLLNTRSFASVDLGVITDFIPNDEQHDFFNREFQPLYLRTLFSVEERNDNDLVSLLCKQIAHYIEVYGLETPGLFDLEVDNGEVVTLVHIHGITRDELTEKVYNILYRNAPVEDAEAVKSIINYYDIAYDINKVDNNELRMLLFDVKRHSFMNGDDAVRWMCYTATERPLLIKNAFTEAHVVAQRHKFTRTFFENHLFVLAQVFNRHKRLILAAKNKNNKDLINKITRLSKKVHVPIKENPAKTFVTRALRNIADVSEKELDSFTIRDKFKYLNILEYKLLQDPREVYKIRNGKTHVAQARPVYKRKNIQAVLALVLESLKKDIEFLREFNILLSDQCDYGLPISRKQAVGQLPFGTKINIEGERISSGIYWENEWGATDLDLSAIDLNNHAVGWNRASGFAQEQDIVFSGDLVDATNGAMEFLTSSAEFNVPYTLSVNIFSGQKGCQTEVVVGNQISKEKGNWIESPILRQKMTLKDRETMIGMVKGNQFTVYACQTGGRSVAYRGSRINGP